MSSDTDEHVEILRRLGVRALCDQEHDGPCKYPECDCGPAFKSEYRSQANCVIAATIGEIYKRALK